VAEAAASVSFGERLTAKTVLRTMHRIDTHAAPRAASAKIIASACSPGSDEDIRMKMACIAKSGQFVRFRFNPEEREDRER